MLGVFWMVLEPLLLVLTLSGVFTLMGRANISSSLNLNDAPFPIFFYSGVLPWTLFTKSLTAGPFTFVQDAGILKKFSFPREILVAKNILLYLIEFGLASLAFGLILLIYGYLPTLVWLWLLPVMGIYISLCFGLVLISGSLNVYIRDVGRLLVAISPILFWCTPIIYRLTGEGLAQYVLSLNPVAGIIESFRYIIIDNQPPSLDLLFWPSLWAILFVGVGYRCFLKLEKGFVDAL
jgi:ABC-type polysaccharide/polyol phosphate export permease